MRSGAVSAITFLMLIALFGCIGAAGHKPQVLRGWGEVIDPDRDCHFSLTNGKLTISIPGTYASLELRSNGQIARFANAAEHPLPGNVAVLKLERHGRKVSASASPDGVQWTSSRSSRLQASVRFLEP